MLDAVSLSHKQFTCSTIINSIIWDASWQVYKMCYFQISFVMKYSQWLNVYSHMPQTVKSPVTSPVQKPLSNIQADNIARASHNDKKICDLSIEAKQTTQKHTTAWVGWSLSLPHPLARRVWGVREWEHLEKSRAGWLGGSSLASLDVGESPHLARLADSETAPPAWSSLLNNSNYSDQ